VALFTFTPPSDVTRTYENRPILSLWTRVSFRAGSTLVQRSDATWAQYDVISPSTEDGASSKFFFGPQGFGGLNTLTSPTSATMGYNTPLRVYKGGHVYVIDDALKTELTAAVTTQHAGGYGAFITNAPAGAAFTGDEILASGWVSEFGRALAP
jgi:hypothetical protein